MRKEQIQLEIRLTELFECGGFGQDIEDRTDPNMVKISGMGSEDRLKNGASSRCQNPPTLKEELLHDAIMKGINNLVENSGDIIETFREIDVQK